MQVIASFCFTYRIRLEQSSGRNQVSIGVHGEVIPRIYLVKTQPSELYQDVKQRGFEVEVLVNDAGQGGLRFVTETDIDAQMRIVHLNIVSQLTHLSFPQRHAGKERRKQFCNSLSGIWIPHPTGCLWRNKGLCSEFTEALISELKDTNITVTALQPGATDTDFFNKAGAEDSKIIADKSKLSDPAKVAKDGFDALMKGDDKVVSGFKNKAQIAMANVIPDTKLADNMKKQSEPVQKKIALKCWKLLCIIISCKGSYRLWSTLKFTFIQGTVGALNRDLTSLSHR